MSHSPVERMIWDKDEARVCMVVVQKLEAFSCSPK